MGIKRLGIKCSHLYWFGIWDFDVGVEVLGLGFWGVLNFLVPVVIVDVPAVKGHGGDDGVLV